MKKNNYVVQTALQKSTSAMCHVPCAMCHVPCAMCHVPCAKFIRKEDFQYLYISLFETAFYDGHYFHDDTIDTTV